MINQRRCYLLVLFQTSLNRFFLVIFSLNQGLACHIINAFLLWRVIVVGICATRRGVNPPIRYAFYDRLVRYVKVNDYIYANMRFQSQGLRNSSWETVEEEARHVTFGRELCNYQVDDDIIWDQRAL